jgi:hypothetical protein
MDWLGFQDAEAAVFPEGKTAAFGVFAPKNSD